jgi:hypothetical protein
VSVPPVPQARGARPYRETYRPSPDTGSGDDGWYTGDTAGAIVTLTSGLPVRYPSAVSIEWIGGDLALFDLVGQIAYFDIGEWDQIYMFQNPTLYEDFALPPFDQEDQ